MWRTPRRSSVVATGHHIKICTLNRQPKASENGRRIHTLQDHNMELPSTDRKISLRYKARRYDTMREMAIADRCTPSWQKIVLAVLVVTMISQRAETSLNSPQAKQGVANDSFQRSSTVVDMTSKLGPQPWTVFLEGGSPWTTTRLGNATQELEYSETKGAETKGIERLEYVFDPNCEPMYDWQMSFHPTCNEFHATNLADVLAAKQAELLGKGWWRQGWKVTYPFRATNIIWKTSLFIHMKDARMVAREKSRVDAVAMEILMQGKLPHIPFHVRSSPDPVVQTLLEAAEACYRSDPKARPTAAQVVAFLENKTSTMNREYRSTE